MHMESKFKADYDSEEDVFYIYSQKSKTKESIEVDEDIILDIDKDNNLTGVEIMYASKFLNKLNSRITRKALAVAKSIGVEVKKYRSLVIITLAFKIDNEVIRERLPAFSAARYESPLVAEVG